MHISKLTRADAFTHSLFDISNELNKMGFDTVLRFEQMLNSYKAEHRITDYRQIPRELMTQYTCGDVWNTLQVLNVLYPRIAENNQQELYKN